MLSKIHLTLLIIVSFACNRVPAQSSLLTDTTSKDYDKVLTKREQKAAEKNT
jgi:hypothetical protein